MKYIKELNIDSKLSNVTAGSYIMRIDFHEDKYRNVDNYNDVAREVVDLGLFNKKITSKLKYHDFNKKPKSKTLKYVYNSITEKDVTDRNNIDFLQFKVLLPRIIASSYYPYQYYGIVKWVDDSLFIELSEFDTSKSNIVNEENRTKIFDRLRIKVKLSN